MAMRHRRILASCILIAFFINLFYADIALARTGGDALAVPLATDDILGVERQDKGRIAIALSEMLSLPLKDMVDRQPDGIQFFFHEKMAAPGGIGIRCRITDPGDRTAAPRTYWAIYGSRANAIGEIVIDVLNEEEFNSLDGIRPAQPRDDQGRFGRLPGKSPEAARLVILLSGLYRQTQFTRAEYLEAYERVRTGAGLLNYPLSKPAETNPYATVAADLDGLCASEIPFLKMSRLGQAVRYGLADRYRNAAYDANFRVFAGLAAHCVSVFDFNGVEVKDGVRLVVEAYRGGTFHDQIAFDAVTGELSFVTIDTLRMEGKRLAIGVDGVTITETVDGLARGRPFRYRGESPIVNALVSEGGDMFLVVRPAFYAAFLRDNTIPAPLVTFASVDHRLPGGTTVMAADPDAVALAVAPESARTHRDRAHSMLIRMTRDPRLSALSAPEGGGYATVAEIVRVMGETYDTGRVVETLNTLVSLGLLARLPHGELAASGRLRAGHDERDTYVSLTDSGRFRAELLAAQFNTDRPRNPDGTFRLHPGKSPLDTLKLMAYDESLSAAPFSVTDLLSSYQDAAQAMGFEPLSEKRPDATIRRDLKQLVAQRYVEPAGERGYYALTKKGRDRVAALRDRASTSRATDLDALIPPELVKACARPEKKLVVGVPTEIKPYAERVGLTPAGVRTLVSFGVTVLVQKGAGREHFSDAEYRASGATMVDTAAEVWARADIIKKVKEPLENTSLGINELERMRPGQIVFTYLHLAMSDCRDLAYAMHRKNVTGIAYETILVSENGRTVTPALRPMSIIAGTLGGYFAPIFSLWSDIVDEGGKMAVRLTKDGQAAMERLKKDYTSADGFVNVAKGKKAVVLGGGVSGVRMAKTLLRLGVSVTITDASPARVEELRALFSIYGKKASVMLVGADLDAPSPELLERYKEADMLGGCILIPGAKAPRMGERLFAEISQAKPKTIVDIAIDQDGNFPEARATYYSDPAYVDSWGNKRFSVANMPDFVGGVASIELEKTNIAWNLALALGFDDAIELFPELKGGVNMREGRLYIESLYGLYPDIPQAGYDGTRAQAEDKVFVMARAFDHGDVSVRLTMRRSSDKSMEELQAAVIGYLDNAAAKRSRSDAAATLIDLVVAGQDHRILAVSPETGGVTYELIPTMMRSGEEIAFKIVRRNMAEGLFTEIGLCAIARAPGSDGNRRGGHAVSRTIADMAALAAEAGRAIPTHPSKRYSLFLPQLFYAGGELKRDQEAYGDRFALDIVPGLDGEDFVRNLRERVRGKEATSVVLIPGDLGAAAEELADLARLGVRVISIDSKNLHSIRGNDPAERAAFRNDTYAVMYLARFIDEATTPSSPAYRLLRYYLETHFTLDSAGMTADEYIAALLGGELAKLIKACLAYRPAVPADALADYRKIAATLIFA